MGNWKSFDELEETLTIDEVNAIIEAQEESRKVDQRFAAALKGIDLDKSEKGADFKDIKARADAKLVAMKKLQSENAEGLSEEEVAQRVNRMTDIEEHVALGINVI